jgi:DNA sulfur modification protein DndB
VHISAYCQLNWTLDGVSRVDEHGKVGQMNLPSMIADSVAVRRCNTYEEARDAAVAEAGATGGQPFPAILFRQGTRAFASTALPMGVIRERVIIREVRRGDDPSAVLKNANRPVMADHTRTIARYVKSNMEKKYILPPMTLNVHQQIRMYVPDYPSEVIACIIVIPRTAKISVTDGGHRFTALTALRKQLDPEQLAELDAHSIAVMISFETDPLQSHQDFADASRTKPLPPSLIAAYDLRNPANGLVIDLIEDCPLFRGKIDSTSKTLSKKSNRLFLTNHIRQMVKTILTGDPALQDEEFVRKAVDMLKERGDPKYDVEKAKIAEFVNIVTNSIVVFAEIAPLPEGRERDLITERRADGYICLTATGLLVMAKIAYELFTKTRLYPNWQEYARKLGTDIDWRKSAGIWQDNIIISGKSFSNKGPLNKAVEAVKEAIAMQTDSLPDLFPKREMAEAIA